MSPKSTIAKLPPEVRSAVDEAIREGRATIDEIVALIRGLGGNASRSAVGRYKQTAEEQMRDFRRAQDMAKVWVDKFGSEPEGDVARLLFQLLGTVAFNTFGTIQEAGGSVEAQDLFFLSRAIKEFETARKTNVEREVKLRAEIEKQKSAAVENVEKIARKKGLDSETIENLKREFLGIGT